MSQFSKYDSEFCGNIPIHIINTIQTYGVLLVLDNDLNVCQASENVTAIFGKDVRAIMGSSLEALTGEMFAAEIAGLKSESRQDRYTTHWEGHYVIAHIKADMVLLEIETGIAAREAASFTEHFRDIRTIIRQVEDAQDVPSLCALAATELKNISGFDKVMIYAFDGDWNGHVLAEAREEDMEAYMGFTFPASDIPKPARTSIKTILTASSPTAILSR